MDAAAFLQRLSDDDVTRDRLVHIETLPARAPEAPPPPLAQVRGGVVGGRHAGPGAPVDPPDRQPDPHEPGHAPRRNPAGPRAVGRLLPAAVADRRGRGARLPRRVRLARRAGASPVAPAGGTLRWDSSVRDDLGHRGQPGRAGGTARGAAVRGGRRGTPPPRREAVFPVGTPPPPRRERGPRE